MFLHHICFACRLVSVLFCIKPQSEWHSVHKAAFVCKKESLCFHLYFRVTQNLWAYKLASLQPRELFYSSTAMTFMTNDLHARQILSVQSQKQARKVEFLENKNWTGITLSDLYLKYCDMFRDIVLIPVRIYRLSAILLVELLWCLIGHNSLIMVI